MIGYGFLPPCGGRLRKLYGGGVSPRLTGSVATELFGLWISQPCQRREAVFIARHQGLGSQAAPERIGYARSAESFTISRSSRQEGTSNEVLYN